MGWEGGGTGEGTNHVRTEVRREAAASADKTQTDY